MKPTKFNNPQLLVKVLVWTFIILHFPTFAFRSIAQNQFVYYYLCPCVGSISQPGSITGSTTVCQNASSIPYSIALVPSATYYTWTVPSDATIESGQLSTAITVNFGTATGNMCVTASNACGNSSQSCITITYFSAPTSVTASAGPNPICIGNSLTLTGGASGATSWAWSGPNAFTSTSQSTTLSITGTVQGGVYTVTATNSCGLATVSTSSVTVKPLPSAPTTGLTILLLNTNSVELEYCKRSHGYEWGTTTTYPANDNGTNVSYTQTGLSCE